MSPRAAKIVSRSLMIVTLLAIIATGTAAITTFDDVEPGQIVVVPPDREPAIAEATSLLDEDCQGPNPSASLADAPSVYCDLQRQRADGATFAPEAADLVTIVGLILGLLWLGTGMVIVSRQPRNAAGWVFHIVGLSLVVELLAPVWVLVGIKAAPGSVPFVGALALVTEYALVAPILIPLLWLFFPDGRPPSDRWRWPVRIYLGAVVLAVGAAVFNPGPLNNLVDLGMVYLNPLGVPNLAGVGGSLQFVGVITALAITVATVIGVRGRYKRAQREERQQLRLLVVVATVAIGSLMLMFGGGVLLSVIVGEDEVLVSWWFPTWFLVTVFTIMIGIPGAYLIAIFKHGLWDLDVVVKKTLVAVVLTAIIGSVALAILGLSTQVAWVLPGPLPFIWLLVVGAMSLPFLRMARRAARRIVFGKRATQQEVLAAFGDRVGESYSVVDVLPRMVRVLASATGASSARVLLRVGDELREEAAVGEPSGEEHLVPVEFEGEELGALAASFPPSDPIDGNKRRLMENLAGQASLVLRNVKLIQELRASRQRLVAAQDQERRKLERNIHDGAQQQLVALTVKLRLAQGLIVKDATKAEAMLDDLQAQTQSTLEDLRDLARGIYPPLLADKGLPTALEAQARKSSVPVRIEAEGVGRYDQDVEAAVYFCTLEALNNVAKYADASAATIGLVQANGNLTFTISDDGRGFDPAATGYGTGLQGMADRLDAIGGSLDVDSAAGRGTRVTGQVPVGKGAER